MKTTRRTAARILLGALSIVLLTTGLLTSCAPDSRTENYGETLNVRIAVVLPLSDGYSGNYRAALDWAASNIAEATSGLSREIRVEYEWYNEDEVDLKALSTGMRERKDLHAVIGPYASQHTREFAAAMRNWLLPVFTLSTSEAVIRENIPSMEDGEFLWALQEADISQCELLLTLAQRGGADTVSLLVKRDDPYGQTFLDWFGFQSSELGLANDLIVEYDVASLEEDMRRILGSPDTRALIAVPSSAEEAGTMVRTQAAMRAGGAAVPEVYYSDIAMSRQVFEGSGAERLGVQGVSVLASPESGFEVAFKIHTGLDMNNIESQIYDAVMLTAMAVFDTELRMQEGLETYDPNNPITRNRAHNRALKRIVDGREPTGGAMTWQPDDMYLAFKALEEGRYVDISGASSSLDFDSQAYTNVLHSTYCHWQYYEGSFLRINYMTSDGSRRTESTLGCWNWSISGGQTFDGAADLHYPELSGNKAILIGASCAWNDYRHQADVMDLYRILLERGYEDDDILLILENNLAFHSGNLFQGIVRTSVDGPNLYGEDIRVDYTLSSLTPDRLAAVLTQELDSDSGDNVLLYWCGHGSPGCLVYGDNMLEASWFRAVVEGMHTGGKYRKLLCLIESCFSGSVAEACGGIPGALLYTAANPNETSKAENFDPGLNVYLSDRFSAAFRQAVSERTDWTMADLYYRLYNHTPGSHVTVYNSDSYGNLYTSTLSEFFPEQGRK